MITITLDEAVNGYIVNLNNWSECKYHKEVCERKIEALEIISNFIKKEVEKEANFIKEGGQFNAI